MRRSSHPVRLPAVAHQNTGIVLQEVSDQFLAAMADVIQFRLVWFNRSQASFMYSSSFDDNERNALSFAGEGWNPWASLEHTDGSESA